MVVHNGWCDVQNNAAAGYFQQDAKIGTGRYRSFKDDKEIPNNYKEDDKAHGMMLYYRYMICTMYYV